LLTSAPTAEAETVVMATRKTAQAAEAGTVVMAMQKMGKSEEAGAGAATGLSAAVA
jgi:hypothetical protein